MSHSDARSNISSLTLLRVFLIASAAILAVAAFILSGVLTNSLRHQVLADREVSLTQFVSAIVGPDVVSGETVLVGPKATSVMESTIARDPEIVTVKVWRADGVLAWTSRAPERIGKRFKIDDELSEALEGTAAGMIGKVHPGERSVEGSLGYTRLLEVYAPIRSPSTNRVVGAYEIYADPHAAEAFIGDRKRTIWLIVIGAFGAIYLALAVLVRGASQALQRRTSDLRARTIALADSYEALERGSLETVEALNAIVEAKDPYTAGHSQRVRRIAELIGAELGLTAAELDALRFGGLFHDIGKVRVPDTILTKPGALTEAEYDVVRQHAGDGAEIVGHLSRLSASVPIIRHHHERWDGRGYPDGLAGNDVPLCAAIVGLADAWDAMTSERPYADALSLDEALDEVRTERASQFHPAVVDAFLCALAAHPQDLAWESAPVAAIA